jgi:hypothetical protein
MKHICARKYAVALTKSFGGTTMITIPHRLLTRTIVVMIVFALLIGASTFAFAQPDPDTADCWGVVTSQLAGAETGAVGEHSSEESTPRIGLANVTRDLFGLDHISELGTLLGEIDGIDATNCPDD